MAKATVLTEVKTTPLGVFSPIREATDGIRPLGLDKKARVARCILITEGLGNLRDKNYYTAEAIESCPSVFEKSQFYIDHPSRDEEENRPERSIRDLAGYFRNCSVGQVKDPETGEALRACFADLVFSESEAGNLAMAQVATALQFQKDGLPGKDVYAGISINAGGLSEAGQIDGMDVNMVREIHDAFSADIVTKPARGGKFLSLMQEAAKTAAWLRARGRGRTLHKEGASMDTTVVKGKLSEAEKARLGVLRKKDPTKLTEAERTELRTLKHKLKGAQEADKPKPEPTAKTREAEGEEEGEAESEADAAEGEGEDEEEADAAEGEGEEEGEAGAAEGEEQDTGGDPMGAMMQMAEGMLGKMKALRGKMGGASEHEGAGEGEGEEEIGPVDADDPKALLADIQADLAAIADHLGAMGGGDEEEPGAPMGDEGEDEAGGHAMKYSCSSCGEENEVLPPKGYNLTKTGESLKFPTDKKGLREALQRLTERLLKKESRFAKTNGHLRQTIEENVRLKAENIMLRREKRAAKALREAGVPADVLSKEDLLTLDPSQWALQIRMAKRAVKLETRVTETIPAGSGGRVGDGKGKGVREAKAAFDSSYGKKA